MSDIAQHLAVSHKVEFEDLDWETAKKIGLTQQEVDSLLYFADIESQTVHYFLEVSKLRPVFTNPRLPILDLFYPPYTRKHRALLSMLIKLKR